MRNNNLSFNIAVNSTSIKSCDPHINTKSIILSFYLNFNKVSFDSTKVAEPEISNKASSIKDLQH